MTTLREEGMRSINMDFTKINIEKGDREEQSVHCGEACKYSSDGSYSERPDTKVVFRSDTVKRSNQQVTCVQFQLALVDHIMQGRTERDNPGYSGSFSFFYSRKCSES